MKRTVGRNFNNHYLLPLSGGFLAVGWTDTVQASLQFCVNPDAGIGCVGVAVLASRWK